MTFVLVSGRSTPSIEPSVRMPTRAPGPGEQYRFHFDMGKCIGCKCCVVACNEQNGNPAAINWRRVGEIEGGWYPQAHRSYLSMGCNHCVNPTCMSGCPVDAFTKDAATGIVLHSADTCIGCQYCTWNCSYGVPQYNPDRGVVEQVRSLPQPPFLGQSPACVSACPSGAIQVEIVNDRRMEGGRGSRAAGARGAGRGSEHFDDADYAAEASRPQRASGRSRAAGAVGGALVAHHHDDADAALRRNARDDLAAATARHLHGPRRRGAHLRPRRRPGAGGVDASSRASGPCVPRAEDVETVVAQPRGAAVHGVLGGRLRCMRRRCGCRYLAAPASAR